MIEFYSENQFILSQKEELILWISNTILNEKFKVGDIQFVFCNDDYLLKINQDFLKHNTYTDIITFNYNVSKIVNTEVYISTERVKENAKKYNSSFTSELHRVIIHGILHLCGYKDKSTSDKELMTTKEDYYLSLRRF